MLDNGNAPHILDFGEPEKENSIIKVIGVVVAVEMPSTTCTAKVYTM